MVPELIGAIIVFVLGIVYFLIKHFLGIPDNARPEPFFSWFANKSLYKKFYSEFEHHIPPKEVVEAMGYNKIDVNDCNQVWLYPSTQKIAAQPPPMGVEINSQNVKGEWFNSCIVQPNRKMYKSMDSYYTVAQETEYYQKFGRKAWYGTLYRMVNGFYRRWGGIHAYTTTRVLKLLVVDCHNMTLLRKILDSPVNISLKDAQINFYTYDEKNEQRRNPPLNREEIGKIQEYLKIAACGDVPKEQEALFEKYRGKLPMMQKYHIKENPDKCTIVDADKFQFGLYKYIGGTVPYLDFCDFMVVANLRFKLGFDGYIVPNHTTKFYPGGTYGEETVLFKPWTALQRQTGDEADWMRYKAVLEFKVIDGFKMTKLISANNINFQINMLYEKYANLNSPHNQAVVASARQFDVRILFVETMYGCLNTRDYEESSLAINGKIQELLEYCKPTHICVNYHGVRNADEAPSYQNDQYRNAWYNPRSPYSIYSVKRIERANPKRPGETLISWIRDDVYDYKLKHSTIIYNGRSLPPLRVINKQDFYNLIEDNQYKLRKLAHNPLIFGCADTLSDLYSEIVNPTLNVPRDKETNKVQSLITYSATPVVNSAALLMPHHHEIRLKMIPTYHEAYRIRTTQSYLYINKNLITNPLNTCLLQTNHFLFHPALIGFNLEQLTKLSPPEPLEIKPGYMMVQKDVPKDAPYYGDPDTTPNVKPYYELPKIPEMRSWRSEPPASAAAAAAPATSRPAASPSAASASAASMPATSRPAASASAAGASAGTSGRYVPPGLRSVNQDTSNSRTDPFLPPTAKGPGGIGFSFGRGRGMPPPQ